MEKTSEDKYVTIGGLSFIVGIIVIAIGWLFIANSALSSKVDQMSGDYVAIQTQLSQIQTDLGWIKTAMSKDSK